MTDPLTEAQRKFYPWHDIMTRIECIVDGPWPVYESLNASRLLDFINHFYPDLGYVRLRSHGLKLQAIIEKDRSDHNYKNNRFIYNVYLPLLLRFYNSQRS
jgi:hypothetical protein